MHIIMINPGDKYGKLTVISRAGSSAHGDALYQCQCECGNICIKKGTILKTVSQRGHSCSCGCTRRKKEEK